MICRELNAGPLKRAGILVIFAFALYAQVFSIFDDTRRIFLPPFRRHIPRVTTFANLGAENRTLGEHLAQGKGFTDAFAFGTGPTAWMSPAYPLLVAGLLRLFDGDMNAAGVAMAIGQAIGLMFIWCALVSIVQPKSKFDRCALFAVLVLFLLTHFEYSFLFTHDNFLGDWEWRRSFDSHRGFHHHNAGAAGRDGG